MRTGWGAAHGFQRGRGQRAEGLSGRLLVGFDSRWGAAKAGDRAENRRYVRIADMKNDDVKAVLGRVLSWPADDQEKVARFVREVEQRRADDDIGEEEWEIIEARAARRDLPTDKEVKQVFARYRRA
jgi:hypothetical protein